MKKIQRTKEAFTKERMIYFFELEKELNKEYI